MIFIELHSTLNTIQLLTGSEDNSCFVWPEVWTVARSRRLRATVQSEGQTKQLLFEEPVYNRFVIPYTGNHVT